jgi:16S rRNA (guanine527-N7)-methyltransferase
VNPAIEIVREESARLGVDLGAAELQHFDKYLALLNKWSASVNVVGTRDLTDVARYHVADSVALVPHLTGRRRIVDVGSGAGLPGAVLAICLPGASVTSLEPIHKKHAFLSAVKRELKLDNFTALAERDEQHRARPDFHPFEAAVSRATGRYRSGWSAVPFWSNRVG